MIIDLEKMSLAEAEAELKNKVYEATKLLETLENAGKLRGNGHHARQEVSDLAGSILKQRWIN